MRSWIALGLLVGCAPAPAEVATRSPAEVFADRLVERGDEEPEAVAPAKAEVPAKTEPPRSDPEVVRLDQPICAGPPRDTPPAGAASACCLMPASFIQQEVGSQQLARMRGCYGDARARDATAAGTVHTSFAIDPDGSTRHACVVASAIQDPVFLRCVADAFAALTWPLNASSPCTDITVSYPLRFAPP